MKRYILLLIKVFTVRNTQLNVFICSLHTITREIQNGKELPIHLHVHVNMINK